MSKKDLNEAEICQNYITPAIEQAGWDPHTQIRREVPFTAGRGSEFVGALLMRHPGSLTTAPEAGAEPA